VALAEKLGARVMTDLKTGASFPTRHPLHVGPPGTYLSESAATAVREADVILALDWIDLAGTLKQVYGERPIGARVIAASCDVHVHRGFSMDYFGLPPVDVNLLAEPDVVVPLLLEACKPRAQAAPSVSAPVAGRRADDVLSLRAVAAALDEGTAGVEVCVTRLPLGWPGDARHFAHPLDYLGGDGGAGVGAGPGITVGAGLALKGSGRIPIGLIGDGDYLMGLTALWTAAHYRIPCLFIVCNNRSFYNDEAHQERVARQRGRPVENKWIGQRINEPDIDLAALAVAQGAKGIGPVVEPEQLRNAVTQAVRAVRDGEVCVIDARVRPGYDADISGERATRQEPIGRT
jgi:thiamine pyrophosphate-dependent acetolactate synthase large subunit-like protein